MSTTGDSKDYVREQKIVGSNNPIPKRINLEIVKQLEKAICRIRIKSKEGEKEKFGTGFLCKIPYPDEFSLLPTLITNNHIINEKDFNENKEIEISFNDGKETKKLITDTNRKFYTSEEYDVSIIQIYPNKESLNYWLEVNKEDNENLDIYVLHYPM